MNNLKTGDPAKNATVKRWLSRYRVYRKEADWLEKEAREWRERAECMTKTLSGMPRGGGHLDAVVEMMQAADDCARRVKDAAEAASEIYDAINRLEDADEVDVLSCLYIRRLSLDKTCKELYLSRRTVNRKHMSGLENVKKYLTN